MGLRLALLDLWTPQFVIHKELDRVAELTTGALKSLIRTYAPEQSIEALGLSANSENVQEKRRGMARDHYLLTEALAKAVGREKAIQIGREALFKAGEELGQDTRRRLGISNSRKDLERAAEVMYRIFDIHVRVDWLEGEKAVLVVNRCTLSTEYSEFTCSILSATDEGIVHGLSPKAHMKFKEKITSGYSNCKADINFDGEKLKK